MSKFSMSNAFVRKLEGYGSLTELDKTLLSNRRQWNDHRARLAWIS